MRLKCYKKTPTDVWQGRIDSQTDRNAFRWHQDVQVVDLDKLPKSGEGRHFAILGFCSDEGVRRNQGRLGAKYGPLQIRHALASLPVHFDESTQICDVGDIVCQDQELEGAQTDLAQVIKNLISKNYIPIVLGGGHEVAYGHGLGLYESIGSKKLGIINFDAHFDLRSVVHHQGTSGTPFLQLSDHCNKQNKSFSYFCLGILRSSNTASLFHTADHLNVSYILRSQLMNQGIKTAKDRLVEFIDQVDAIYLTVCLDAFAAAFAPGVSAPSAFGIYPEEFFPLFETIIKSQKVMSFDVAELSPPLDPDHQTARLAAKIIYEFVENFGH